MQLARRPGYGALSAMRRAATGVFPYVASAAAATKAALSATSGKQKTITPPVLSAQYDQSRRYRYKRMPRRKRRIWKRFVNKVNHVSLQQQPLQIYTKTVHNALSTAAGNGGYAGYMIGGVQVGNNDELLQIFKNAYNLLSAAACAGYRIYVKSICLDMILSNTGTSTIIADVYRLRCRKDYSTASQVDTQFTAAIGEIAAPSGGGTVATTDPAITPFDVPNFCSYWKILEKREVIIGAGSVSTFQMRKPMNKHLEGKELATSTQAIPGYTEAYFVTWHGAPNATTFAATGMTLSTTLTLHYAIPPGKTAEAGRTG